jgi:hypothetical protein
MTATAFDPANDDLIIATPRKEIVFIEDNVADIDTLIKGIGSGKEVVILDSTVDGLHQIAQALAGRSGVDALHIVSHGAAGSLNLGAVTLDANGLEARHDELQAIGHSLREGGDILLYGCGVGADTGGQLGAGFVERFAIASGADVAASSNLTGASDLGGDWNLEITSGQVETAAVVNADTAALYHGVLAGIQNRTATFSTFTNFINPPHTVYDGAQADIVYKVDGLDAYRLVIDAPSTAVAAYEYANTYVNVAGQPPGGLIETSVNLSFQGGQVFNLTSLEISKTGSPGGEHLVFTGVDKDNQVHTTSADLTSGSAIPVTVNFTGFTDIKQLTITTTDNNGVFTFFSLDNIAFSSIQPPPPPAAPSAPDLDANYDKGSSSSDNVTNLTTLKFTGTAGAGATTVKLYDTDGTTEIGSAAVSSGTYTITTTGTLSNGTHTITAKAFDAFGNASTASSSLNVTVDTSAPAVAITSNQTALKAGETATITFTFSEDPGATFTWNGSAGDVVVSGGTLSAISGTGLTRTATFMPAANTDTHAASITVGAGSFADAAGNVNTAAGATPSISYDTKPPTLAITSDHAALKVGETATITFTFSEDPGSSFDASDLTVSGGTLSGLGTTGAVRTATFTPTAGVNNGTASIDVASGTFSDAAGNGNTAAGNGPAIAYDTLAPNNPSVPVLAAADDKGDSSSDGITSKGTLQFSGTADAGATVTLYDTDGATVVGSGSADGSGNWSFNATLAAGTHTIKAVAFDAAGNASGVVTGPQVTVDTTPPTLSITSNAATLKAGDTATITFTFSEDPGSSFDASDLTVSGGTLSAISGTGLTRTATFTPTADTDAGSAHISVATGTYHDLAGNDGAASNTLTLGYDTLAPAAPGTPDLAAGNDSGTSSSDNVTGDDPLSFSGSAANGVTVRLYDGATEVGHVTASGGTWTIPVAGLGEGSHTLTAVAYDAAGNASVASGGLVVTVDQTPPATTVAGAALSQDTGASATDMVTKEAVQTISGTLSANLAAGEQVMVSLDNGATWNPATASVGSNAWELPATLAGSGTLKVQVVDAAGNGGAVYAQAYVLDTTPPAAPSTPDLDAGSDSGISDTDNITGVTLPSFSGTAAVGAKVTLFDGGNEIGSAVATDGTWHITTGSAWAMNERTHSITAIATDLAGNASTNSSALEVDVRTAGPGTTVASMALSADSGAAGDFITNTAAQTVSGTLSANLASGERVQVSLNNGSTWTDAAGTVGQSTWSLPVTLAAGSHDIQVRLIDAIDNFSTVFTQAYTLDTVKPSVTITSSAAQLMAGETATITFTFSEDPGASFSWNGSAGDLAVSGGTLSAISGTGLTRTATFTPAADTNGGTASIGVTAGSYADTAGNTGTAGTPPALTFDTLAPAAPSAPDLHHDSDSGALDTDNVTHETALVFTGTAEAGATVRLFDTDGTTEIGHATATGGNWTITTSALSEGSHTVTAKAIDAAGNASPASGALTVTVDTAKPAAMAAPALADGSDSAAPGDGITKVAKLTVKGSAEALALVTVYDGAAVLGTTSANASGAWEFTPAANLLDGTHAISARQTDLAGNQSDAGTVFSLTIDTVAPAAPSAPLLKATSDTGTLGDGITENSMPVIEGTALANTLVTLYDVAGAGKIKIGSALADGSGKWSVAAAGLSVGAHSLTATQSDAAGNESAPSAAFALRIDAPPVPVNLIDGVAVDIQPISLPGGIAGSAISVPIVTDSRLESSGHAGVADIPLVTSVDGTSLLLAQVPVGAGLSASGASVPAANGAALLLAAIKAATPSHAPTDQGHLTSNGQTFLAGLSSSGTLLVETVKPVSAANAPDAVLTLSGPAQPNGQSTALVIDASGMGAGATIALQDVSFAAVIGAANVTAANGMILTGDAASQHFTVKASSGPNAVLAGGGNDTLTLSQAGGTGGAVTLHGGAASDVAVFSGARADYNLAFHNGYVTVSAKAGPATTATVINVETLQFSDGSVAVQNSADMSTLAGIYQSVLGRQADVKGIEFWADTHQAGVSWGRIALDIVASNEHTGGHEGFTGQAAHDLALLYTALFNRAPDAAGLAYWTDVMAHGVSLEQVATGFVTSVEMVGHQRGALDWEFITA